MRNAVIEINKNATINNFVTLLEALGDDAWGVAIAGNKKERIEFYNERYEKRKDIVEEELCRMIEDFFDLQKVVASMPEDVSEEIMDKWGDMVYERKFGKNN